MFVSLGPPPEPTTNKSKTGMEETVREDAMPDRWDFLAASRPLYRSAKRSPPSSGLQRSIANKKQTKSSESNHDSITEVQRWGTQGAVRNVLEFPKELNTTLPMGAVGISW